MWSWAVAPSGSRLLLATGNQGGNCCLDHFETKGTPLCIDGRYGDKYYTPNPETLRLSVEAAGVEKINNTHENMARNDNRVQNLEIVRIKRRSTKSTRRPLQHKASTILGWVLLVGLTLAGIILERWLLFAYLTIVALTGGVISILYGGQPRKLSVHQGSEYERLFIVTKHTNEKNWQVSLGESTVVNALLNKPLENSSKDEEHSPALLLALQGLICMQWAAAIGSAATKSWDAYAISFWVLFCFTSHKYFFSGDSIAKLWLAEGAGIDIHRYRTQLSSRRALLNTILVLNPDSFAKAVTTQTSGEFNSQALRWLDPILERSRERDNWQEASRLALLASLGAGRHGDRRGAAADHCDWERTYGSNYWCKYISEGIEVALKIGASTGARTSLDSSLKARNLSSFVPSQEGGSTSDKIPE